MLTDQSLVSYRGIRCEFIVHSLELRLSGFCSILLQAGRFQLLLIGSSSVFIENIVYRKHRLSKTASTDEKQAW
jgi:hypothetical protein